MERTQGRVQRWGSLNIATEKGGLILWGTSAFPMDEQMANVQHVHEIWNASDGMPTEKAVEYLEHGAVWDLMIENIITAINDNSLTAHDALIKISTILAGLEGK